MMHIFTIIKPGIETINLLILSEIIYKITFPVAIFLVIIATFSTVIVGINRSLSLFYGGSSLLIIVDGILDTFQRK